jgi:hypothetical protein
MSVEILPPLPGSGKNETAQPGPEGVPREFAYSGGGFSVVRVHPLLAAALMILFLLILLPLLLLASLFFGFRLWRRALLPFRRR